MFGLTSRSPTADSSQPSQGSSSFAHSGRSRNVIFGVDLEKSVAMANTPIRVKDPRGEMTTLGYLPVVVAKCGKAIKDYPEAASLLLHPIKVDQKLLSALEKKFESDPKYGRDIKWERIKGSMASALAAALFIKFLDDLPDPLFPHSLYPKLEAAHRIEGTYEERKQRYVKVFCMLPVCNMYVLLYIIDMLDIVSRHRDVEIAVLARAFAPTVFRKVHPKKI
ncbi:hypothetical protein FRB99_008354 [Tulasnella sp. 403]|nr:hypothetical protein FRB99_008354 [Tulasnella sp. 403]